MSGVVLMSGAIQRAEVVEATDYPRPRSKLLIARQHTLLKSGGRSIDRTAFPRASAMQGDAVRKNAKAFSFAVLAWTLDVY